MIEKPLKHDARLIDAVRAIEFSHRRIAVVVDSNNRLRGTLTDGDIRRHLLAGGGMESQVADVMNADSLSANESSSKGHIEYLMRSKNIVAIPILDADGKYLRLVHRSDLVKTNSHSKTSVGFRFAVIMAGGEGTRLRPLTATIPKPMVEIGGVPLIARQIQMLADVQIPRIYISINYLGHVIEDYFGNGDRFGIEIKYIREREKKGTAGAITLLPEEPDGPFIVMNGDIFTTFDFESLYRYHVAHNATVTMAGIDHQINIPYGVIQSEGSRVTSLIEKPSQRFLCNAGIYALSPEALQHLSKNAYSNMTDLIEICLSKRIPVAVFPVYEYWNDVGTLADLEKARSYFFSSEVDK